MGESKCILNFVKEKLVQNKGRLPAISRECDVPYSTLIKISQGVSTNPRVTTVQKIANFFRQEVA